MVKQTVEHPNRISIKPTYSHCQTPCLYVKFELLSLVLLDCK